MKYFLFFLVVGAMVFSSNAFPADEGNHTGETGTKRAVLDDSAALRYLPINTVLGLPTPVIISDGTLYTDLKRPRFREGAGKTECRLEHPPQEAGELPGPLTVTSRPSQAITEREEMETKTSYYNTFPPGFLIDGPTKKYYQYEEKEKMKYTMVRFEVKTEGGTKFTVVCVGRNELPTILQLKDYFEVTPPVLRTIK